ncbi:hypothetical protein TWF696_008831 [Orbilia brochopaga]|uniref:Uncharacterized protein n=1 Tax=Orbilia brochopaga TaxID=3140254 RepID=A0AAV9UDE7_9PEZI
MDRSRSEGSFLFRRRVRLVSAGVFLLVVVRFPGMDLRHRSSKGRMGDTDPRRRNLGTDVVFHSRRLDRDMDGAYRLLDMAMDGVCRLNRVMDEVCRRLNKVTEEVYHRLDPGEDNHYLPDRDEGNHFLQAQDEDNQYHLDQAEGIRCPLDRDEDSQCHLDQVEGSLCHHPLDVDNSRHHLDRDEDNHCRQSDVDSNRQALDMGIITDADSSHLHRNLALAASDAESRRLDRATDDLRSRLRALSMSVDKRRRHHRDNHDRRHLRHPDNPLPLALSTHEMPTWNAGRVNRLEALALLLWQLVSRRAVLPLLRWRC